MDRKTETLLSLPPELFDNSQLSGDFSPTVCPLPHSLLLERRQLMLVRIIQLIDCDMTHGHGKSHGHSEQQNNPHWVKNVW